MQKWEYLHLERSGLPGQLTLTERVRGERNSYSFAIKGEGSEHAQNLWDKLASHLDKLGAQGWELVSDANGFWFKRPKP